MPSGGQNKHNWPTIRIWLRNPKAGKVRWEGDCLIWLGPMFSEGYGRVNFANKKFYAHVLAFKFANKVEETNRVDHRCHNRLCVNPEHLRDVTGKQNAEHRQDTDRGVTQKGSKWYTQVGHNYERYSAGYFDTKEEAIEAARKLRNELFTHNDLDR